MWFVNVAFFYVTLFCESGLSSVAWHNTVEQPTQRTKSPAINAPLPSLLFPGQLFFHFLGLISGVTSSLTGLTEDGAITKFHITASYVSSSCAEMLCTCMQLSLGKEPVCC